MDAGFPHDRVESNHLTSNRVRRRTVSRDENVFQRKNPKTIGSGAEEYQPGVAETHMNLLERIKKQGIQIMPESG